MKLKLDIDPDIVAMMAAEITAGERAVSAAIRAAGNAPSRNSSKLWAWSCGSGVPRRSASAAARITRREARS